MPQEGIFVLEQSKEPNSGIFTLPLDFDKKAHVSEWVKKGPEVDAKKGPQPIIGTNYGSEGWQVWLYPPGHKMSKRPCEVATKTGPYILMFRPKAVQEQVNALYGNVSKQHLIREQSGESIAGQQITDSGILSDERIKQATGITEFGGDEPKIQMNPVRLSPRIEAPPAATAEA